MKLSAGLMGKIREQGGWRENNVLDNLASYSYRHDNGNRVIRFTDNKGYSCEYSLKKGGWTN